MNNESDETSIGNWTNVKILEWDFSMLEIDERASGEMRGILKEGGIGTEDFA